MDLITQYFTVDAPLALLIVLTLGILTACITFFNECVGIYRRALWLFHKDQRKNWTWRTVLWLPFRFIVVIIIPQVIYIIFTQVLNFS